MRLEVALPIKIPDNRVVSFLIRVITTCVCHVTVWIRDGVTHMYYVLARCFRNHSHDSEQILFIGEEFIDEKSTLENPGNI